jgi:hypothetical protein
MVTVAALVMVDKDDLDELIGRFRLSHARRSPLGLSTRVVRGG